MKPMQYEVGLVYATVPVVLLPFYARIIYIFLSKAKYRSLECYRIMVAIGLVQCSMAPCMFLVGLTHILDEDPFGLASNGMKVMTAALRMCALLSFVLALNRLKIICGLQYPQFIHTILVILILIYGVLYVAILMTPYANYIVTPGQFLSKYDYSKPYSETTKLVGTVTIMVSCTLTLLVYVAITAYLVRVHLKATENRAFGREKSILAYSVIRFVTDVILSIHYNYATNMNPGDLEDFLCYLAFILNNLLFPTVLYLVIYKSLREEFVFVQWRNQNTVHMIGTTDTSSRTRTAANYDRRCCFLN